MDLEKIRLKRLEAEAEIEAALKRFEDECKVEISYVEISSLPTGQNIFINSRHKASIKVEL